MDWIIIGILVAFTGILKIIIFPALIIFFYYNAYLGIIKKDTGSLWGFLPQLWFIGSQKVKFTILAGCLCLTIATLLLTVFLIVVVGSLLKH
jgi:hypothetical protein